MCRVATGRENGQTPSTVLPDLEEQRTIPPILKSKMCYGSKKKFYVHATKNNKILKCNAWLDLCKFLCLS